MTIPEIHFSGKSFNKKRSDRMYFRFLQAPTLACQPSHHQPSSTTEDFNQHQASVS
jgi:hypothetical protein